MRIFDDRLEVWSPGMLLPRLIADRSYLIKYVERWGTGTKLREFLGISLRGVQKNIKGMTHLMNGQVRLRLIRRVSIA